MDPNTRMRYITADGAPPMGGRPPQTRAVSFSPPPPYSATLVPIPPRPDFGYVQPIWDPLRPVQPGPPPRMSQAPPAHHARPSNPPPNGAQNIQQAVASDLPSRVPPGMQLDGTYISLPNGFNYLFPEKHTVLHVVAGGHLPWENPGQEFGFTRHKAPCTMTIKELIRQLGATKGDDDKNGITECMEGGDGGWIIGSSFFQKDEKSSQTLEALGWDESRGKERKPVWIAVHKGSEAGPP